MRPKFFVIVLTLSFSMWAFGKTSDEEVFLKQAKAWYFKHITLHDSFNSNIDRISLNTNNFQYTGDLELTRSDIVIDEVDQKKYTDLSHVNYNEVLALPGADVARYKNSLAKGLASTVLKMFAGTY